MTIDKNQLKAVERLQEFGTVEKVSFLLNIFSVEVDLKMVPQIQDIQGVLSVEENCKGSLMFA